MEPVQTREIRRIATIKNVELCFTFFPQSFIIVIIET